MRNSVSIALIGAAAILLLATFALSACETKQHADAELKAIDKAKEVAAAASLHADTTVEEDVGIPECDDYIRKVEACIASGVPENERPGLQSKLDAQRKRWRAGAKSEFDRPAMVDACRSATASANHDFAGYDCHW